MELTEADRSTLAKTYDDMKQTLSGEAIEQVSERNRIKAQLALKLALEKKLELALAECEQLKTTVQEEEQQLKEAGSQKEALEEEIRNLDNLEITEANQKYALIVDEFRFWSAALQCSFVLQNSWPRQRAGAEEWAHEEAGNTV